MRKCVVVLFLFLASLTAISCSGQKDPAAVVNKYYTAIVAADYGTAYDCLSSDTRGKYSSEQFKENYELQRKAWGLEKYEIAKAEKVGEYQTFVLSLTRNEPDYRNADWVAVTTENNQYKIIIHDEFNHDTSWACIELGLKQIDNNNYENAIYYFNQGVELDPLNDPAYKALAIAYSEINNYAKTIETADKYIGMYSKFKEDRSTLSYMYYLRACALFDQNKRDEAKADYQRAFQIDPTNNAAYIMLLKP